MQNNPGLSDSNREPQSSLDPDGWIGEPDELQLARRYRETLRWGNRSAWVIIIAFWLLRSTGSQLPQIPILLAVVAWGVWAFVLQRRISRIIGRKWSFGFEARERRQWKRSGK